MSLTTGAYRIFQAVMRITAAFFSFTPPLLLEGAGSVKKLPAFIKSKGFTKVLVVTDKGLMSVHLLDGLFASLAQEGVSYSLFDGAQANPTSWPTL